MALYSYRKYTIGRQYTATKTESTNLGANSRNGYPSISVNPSTGAITASGAYQNMTSSSGDAGKVLYDKAIENMYLRWYLVKDASGGFEYYNMWQDTYVVSSQQGAGSFLGEVVAENGAYPLNGPHTDGYWYVRGSIYDPNTSPTVPGKPVATGDFRAGGTVGVNWTPSTDAQGQAISYQLEIREYKNGVAGDWRHLVTTSSNSVNINFSTDSSITQIEFRVRAYDSLSAYSGFSAISDRYNLTNNKVPTINLTTIDGRTFYENETFLISGTAKDLDIGNVVNVKYQINSEPVRAIETKISTGADISFNRTLTLKNSRLLDGTTPVTEVLGDGSQHVLKVWAEDDQGGKSPEQIRTFYVVANRAPVINVDNTADQSGMVNADTIRITGRANDPDGNEITAKYRINTGALIDLPLNNGEWIVTLPIKQLVDGNNNITIEVTDSYNFKSTKTIRLRKDFRATELPESVQRYKIEPPRGSAKGILLWVQREESQTVEASISMVDSGEQESYTPMNLSVTAPVGNGMVEDEFIYEADTARASIHLKLNITGSGSVALISGVLL